MSKLSYLHAFTLPLYVWISFHHVGLWSWTPVLVLFVALPLLELLIKPNANNLNDQEKQKRNKDGFYRILLRLALPVVGVYVYLFTQSVSPALDTITLLGRISSMGLMLGVLGINIAHELGHKTNTTDPWIAKCLLFFTFYTHFHLEHNYGHHRNVGLKKDPSTARKGEWLYAYWLRSIFMGWLSAWKIGMQRAKGHWWRNEVLFFSLVHLLLLAGIYFLFGIFVLLAYLGAAVFSWLLLETVQYIEHYGLVRHKVSGLLYENVDPKHSWNSNHLMGRTILFELSRHSDHHAWPHKDYPVLDHHDESPQLPTGYPGMMLLSLVPPLFFWVIHPRMH